MLFAWEVAGWGCCAGGTEGGVLVGAAWASSGGAKDKVIIVIVRNLGIECLLHFVLTHEATYK